MADLDTSIYMPMIQRNTPLMNWWETGAGIQKLRGMEQQNAMGQMELDQARRAQLEQQEVMEVMRKVGGDINRAAPLLRQRGLTGAAGALENHMLKTQELQAKTNKEMSDAEFKRLETTLKGTEASYNRIASYASKKDLTHDDLIGEIGTNLKLGLIDGQTANSLAARVLATPPQGLRGVAAQFGQMAASATENLKAQMPGWKDLGDRLQGYNQLTGEDIPGLVKKKAASPESVLSSETTRRGQNMVDARARESNMIAAQGNVIKGETDLRKEFADLPEVKNYKLAVPSYESIKSASGRDTPQSDINIIYGIAKLYDPNSVVREGEYNTIANSQAIPERIKGMAQRLAGGGKLTKETKQQLLQEAETRIGAYRNEYENARKGYTGIAQQRGLRPESVFTDIGKQDGNKPSPMRGGQAKTAVNPKNGKTYYQHPDGKYYLEPPR